MIGRREFLAATGMVLGTAAAGMAASPASKPATRTAGASSFDESAYDWHDVKPWGVEGQGFSDTAGDYDRLPGRAKGVVREAVWHLSTNSAGLSVSFRANTPAIATRYVLNSSNVAMPHMPATGVSGVDLYARDAAGKWRWVGVSRPSAQRVAAALAQDMDPVDREYRLYLPLYNGVKKLELGFPKGVEPRPIAPRREGTVVYYGTSIAQGGCASRPGMAFTSVLSRWLDRPFINLAFSGNGKMEENVGRFLVELDPALYVIDCLPNMGTQEVKERTIPLVRQLRKVRSTTPILLVDDRINQGFWVRKSAVTEHRERQQALRDAYDRLAADGEKNIHYLPGGDQFFGEDGEATVDGSHPTDLGMVRYAEQLQPVLKKILG